MTENETPTTIKGWLSTSSFQEQVQAALPKQIGEERFIRAAITSVNLNPALAKCEPSSLLNACLELAQYGLMPDGRHAHIIPYGKKATLIIDYKGYVDLLHRSGRISKIHADVVCENDTFEYDRGEVVAHKIDFSKPRGDMYCCYAMVKTKDGVETATVLSKEEVDNVRAMSQGGSSPAWKNHYPEMAKKTALRRLTKMLSISPDVDAAIARDDEQFEFSKPKPAEPVFSSSFIEDAKEEGSGDE